MIAKIISSRGRDMWYANRIGEAFEVTVRDREWFRVEGPEADKHPSGVFIYASDAEIVTDYAAGYQSALEDAAKFVETHYVVMGDTERIVIDISDWDEQTSSKLEQKALAAAIRQLAKETK